MSQPNRSFDPTLVQAAVSAVRSRLPDGEPLTLDALEDAIFEVFQQLGPAVAEEVATPAGGQKKGHRHCAVGNPRAGSAGDNGE